MKDDLVSTWCITKSSQQASSMPMRVMPPFRSAASRGWVYRTRLQTFTTCESSRVTRNDTGRHMAPHRRHHVDDTTSTTPLPLLAPPPITYCPAAAAATATTTTTAPPPPTPRRRRPRRRHHHHRRLHDDHHPHCHPLPDTTVHTNRAQPARFPTFIHL